MNTKINIKQISTEDTYSIRQKVLRPGKPIDTCKFIGDDEKDTFHLGLYYKNELVGISTYMKNKNTVFKDLVQYQLRGMAVLPEFRGLNFGKQLLIEGKKILKEKHLLWFNARATAVKFYNNNNYHTIGDYFNIEGVGKHIIMYKAITKNKEDN